MADPGVVPWLVSAPTEAALRAEAGRLHERLESDPGLSPLDVAFSLAGRDRPEHRAAVVGGEREGLLAGIGALARDERAPGLFRGVATGGKTAVMFTGQGAQRPGMGSELYESFPVFREALDAVCEELDPRVGRSMKELMFDSDAELLSRTEYTQTSLFALEVSLYRVLESLGVRPDYLIGHSIGELAAAHVAGVLSLEDACALVAARGRLMGALPEGGAMVAVQASEREVREGLDGLEDRLAVAGVNAPRAVVVSGDEDAAEELKERWKEEGRKSTRLRVSHAFHSHRMEPMLDEFRELAGSLSFERPSIPIVSNVTGEPVSDEVTTPDYWARHVRGTVRFLDGVRFLEGEGVTRYLELGPDAVLSGMARQCLTPGNEEEEPLLVATLRRRKPEPEALVGFLAAAHVHGADVDFEALLLPYGPAAALP